MTENNKEHPCDKKTSLLCAQLKTVRELIDKYGLPMKPIQIKREDGNLTIFFSAEGRVDFRTLAHELNTVFKEPVRLHQVGARDEAKIIGGFGPCQRPLCCKSFLNKFESVPQHIAKKQSSSNLSQSTGLCGKLMCCLAFDENVVANRKTENIVNTVRNTETVTPVESEIKEVEIIAPVVAPILPETETPTNVIPVEDSISQQVQTPPAEIISEHQTSAPQIPEEKKINHTTHFTMSNKIVRRLRLKKMKKN